MAPRGPGTQRWPVAAGHYLVTTGRPGECHSVSALKRAGPELRQKRQEEDLAKSSCHSSVSNEQSGRVLRPRSRRVAGGQAYDERQQAGTWVDFWQEERHDFLSYFCYFGPKCQKSAEEYLSNFSALCRHRVTNGFSDIFCVGPDHERARVC